MRSELESKASEISENIRLRVSKKSSPEWLETNGNHLAAVLPDKERRIFELLEDQGLLTKHTVRNAEPTVGNDDDMKAEKLSLIEKIEVLDVDIEKALIEGQDEVAKTRTG